MAEYRGVQYQIVQTANPTGFKWIVHLDATRTRTGTAHSMKAAIIDAQRKIDRALKGKGPRTFQCFECNDGPDPLKTETTTGWLKSELQPPK